MEKIVLVLINMLLFSTLVKAQSPQGIPYQGVARNASGAILANQPISLRMSIHDVTTTGAVVYNETHAITTTSLGQFSITIGLGTPITATFASINWGMGAKFLQVELSTNAGSSYLDMGTTQFMSVPYALYAGNSSNGVTTHYIGESYGGGIVFYVYDNGQHGLIAATEDLRGIVGSIYDGLIYWNASGNPTTKASGVKGGLKNTIALYSSGSNDNPVRLCFNYNNIIGVRYSDWYLPSLYELQLLYAQKLIVGGFNNDPITGGNGYYSYWTSEYNLNGSGFYLLHFVTGLVSSGVTPYGRARPIRSF